MDFPTFLGYFSGLYLIKPDIEVSTLFHTVSLVHILDAVLCRLVAAHGGRNKDIWTFAGLFFGIWALGTLFLLSERRADQNAKCKLKNAK